MKNITEHSKARKRHSNITSELTSCLRLGSMIMPYQYRMRRPMRLVEVSDSRPQRYYHTRFVFVRFVERLQLFARQ